MEVNKFSPAFLELYQQHSYTGALKTRMFEAGLGEDLARCAWQADLTKPQIVLGKEARPFMVQVLGTYVPRSQQWLWSWANTESNLPETAVRAAHGLRKFGQDHDIPEFVNPTLQLTAGEVADLGMVVSSVLGQPADTFFGGNAGDVIVGLVVCQSGYVELSEVGTHALISTITNVPMSFNALPRAIVCVLEACGYRAWAEGPTIIKGQSSNGRGITAIFDSEKMTFTIEGWLTDTVSH